MKPYISQLDSAYWRSSDDEQTKEFCYVFDKFSKDLKEALTSLSGTIELPKYDKRWDKEAKNIHTLKNPDPEMKKHFQDLFELWNTKIEEYLNESEAGPGKPKDRDPGPRSELEYWRKRMQKLSCISEEIRSPHCKIVQNVINHVSSNANDNPGRNIYLLQSKLRTQDMKITEAINKAKNNVKYLITLEPFITPLYEETPDVVKDTLPALMNSIKWYTSLQDITIQTTEWPNCSKRSQAKWLFAAKKQYLTEKLRTTSYGTTRDSLLIS